MARRRRLIGVTVALGAVSTILMSACGFDGFGAYGDIHFNNDGGPSGPDPGPCRTANDAACNFCQECAWYGELCCSCFSLAGQTGPQCQPNGIFGCGILCSDVSDSGSPPVLDAQTAAPEDASGETDTPDAQDAGDVADAPDAQDAGDVADAPDASDGD